MSPLVLSLILGFSAAAANSFGGFIIVQKNWSRAYLKYFVALGSGFMLATAILEMIPEGTRLSGDRTPLYILIGYLLVHFFEHTVTSHFHFGEETHHHEFEHSHRSVSVFAGLMIHTFFDGIAIASGFLVSDWLGWIVFLAVFLHKIPEGFTVASVMLAGGKSKRIAFGSSAMLGLATVAGVLAMSLLSRWLAIGLPLAAGVTLYVAASDLIPEVNREPGAKVAFTVFAGVALLFVLDHFFRSV